MNLFEDSSNEYNYRYPSWSPSISRPNSSSRSKTLVNDINKLQIDNRNQTQRPFSPAVKRTIEHHIHIPTGSRLNSPHGRSQRTPPTPDANTRCERPPSRLGKSRVRHSIPIRLKSPALSTRLRKEMSSQNFPRQTHEQRKLTDERKRRKQQLQILADKYHENETWFQLQRSLSQLKRHATVQDILNDSNTSFFNQNQRASSTLKQVNDQENNEPITFKSESNDSIARQVENSTSSFGSLHSAQDLNPPSLTISRVSFSRPRTAQRSREKSSQVIYKPLIVTSKPIHPNLTNQQTPSSKSRINSSFAPFSNSRPNTTSPVEQKHTELTLSILSNNDNSPPSLPIPTTPTSPTIKFEEENISGHDLTPSPTPMIPPITVQLTSKIKLQNCIPRSRRVNQTNKSLSRFILIADQKHQVESWYHHFPFIHGEDLLTLFQSKQKRNSSTISAFFIDDSQIFNSNMKSKTFLQGKPFDINNDWKNYDLILISDNIFQDIIIYLKTIINLISRLSGNRIHIFEINHEQDLKVQVKNMCQQLQQSNFSEQ